MPQYYPQPSRAPAQINTPPTFQTPPEEDFNTEAMRGSLQQLLSENLGEFVVIEFLIGTQTTMKKFGILYAVGRNTVTLYEEGSQTFVVCDIFSIKFVTFYFPGQRPGATGNLPNALQSLYANPETPPLQLPGTSHLSREEIMNRSSWPMMPR